MIEIEVKMPESLERLESRTFYAQKKALNYAGFAASKAIEADVRRLDKPKHPLSQHFVAGVQWQKAQNPTAAAYSTIAPFARHITHGFSTVTFGFGYFRGTPRAKEGRNFDRKLQGIARGITEKRTTPVTPAMRRKLAATKGVIGTDPGKTYFPLKRTTTQLVKPARKMHTRKTIDVAVGTFRREFATAFSEATK